MRPDIEALRSVIARAWEQIHKAEAALDTAVWDILSEHGCAPDTHELGADCAKSPVGACVLRTGSDDSRCLFCQAERTFYPGVGDTTVHYVDIKD